MATTRKQQSFREQRKQILADPERRARVEAGTAALVIAQRLYDLRQARGMTQTDIAKKLGVTQKRVSAIEHARDLNLSTLERYVGALGGELQAGIKFKGEKPVSLT